MQDFISFCEENDISYFVLNNICYAYCGGDYFFIFDARDYAPKVFRKVGNNFICLNISSVVNIELYDDFVYLRTEIGISATYSTKKREPMRYYPLCMFTGNAKFLFDNEGGTGLIIYEETEDAKWCDKSSFIFESMKLLIDLVRLDVDSNEIAKVKEFIRKVEEA